MVPAGVKLVLPMVAFTLVPDRALDGGIQQRLEHPVPLLTRQPHRMNNRPDAGTGFDAAMTPKVAQGFGRNPVLITPAQHDFCIIDLPVRDVAATVPTEAAVLHTRTSTAEPPYDAWYSPEVSACR